MRGPARRGDRLERSPEPLFEALYEPAERARWRVHEIPWDDVDPAVADEVLVALAREAAGPAGAP